MKLLLKQATKTAYCLVNYLLKLLILEVQSLKFLDKSIILIEEIIQISIQLVDLSLPQQLMLSAKFLDLMASRCLSENHSYSISVHELLKYSRQLHQAYLAKNNNCRNKLAHQAISLLQVFIYKLLQFSNNLHIPPPVSVKQLSVVLLRPSFNQPLVESFDKGKSLENFYKNAFMIFTQQNHEVISNKGFKTYGFKFIPETFKFRVDFDASNYGSISSSGYGSVASFSIGSVNLSDGGSINSYYSGSGNSSDQSLSSDYGSTNLRKATWIQQLREAFKRNMKTESTKKEATVKPKSEKKDLLE